MKILPINGFPGYFVSDDGTVWNKGWGEGKQTLTPRVSNRGYARVLLRRDNKNHEKLVHRLVAAAFIPNPLGLPTVNHIDLNKLNNSVANLEWMSLQDNIRHFNLTKH